jgi:hypothetical protein
MLYILKRCYNIFFFNICSLFRQHFGTNIFLDQHFFGAFSPSPPAPAAVAARRPATVGGGGGAGPAVLGHADHLQW